jgi:hypothetical protein
MFGTNNALYSVFGDISTLPVGCQPDKEKNVSIPQKLKFWENLMYVYIFAAACIKTGITVSASHA